MILMAASVKDVAGTNIANQVLKLHLFTETGKTFQERPVFSAKVDNKEITLVTLQEETVYSQNLFEDFEHVDLLVFLSRHSSASGTPTLSVHTPGNFGVAELGGLPRKVSIAPASAMLDALKALMRLKTEMRLDYEVSYECTHHGPSLNVPTMFVELGSSPKQWSDLEAAKAVAQAAVEAVLKFGKSQRSAVLGIGGPHYNRRFTEFALEDKAVFGHMIPKYALHLVDAELLRQCVDCTLERVEYAVLDWKGIRGEDKPHILEAMAEIKLPWQKV